MILLYIYIYRQKWSSTTIWENMYSLLLFVKYLAIYYLFETQLCGNQVFNGT